MPIEALILDYGNVLSHPQPENWSEEIAAQVGVSTAAFREAYWRHRLPYDTGLPAAEYWRRVLETLGHSSGALDQHAAYTGIDHEFLDPSDVPAAARRSNRADRRTGAIAPP
jgi:hypothetical protein